jgi:hypothetical protein
MHDLLHWLFSVFGDPGNLPPQSYFGVAAALFSTFISVTAATITGLLVYWFVTRRQQRHLDHMRISDRLKFIHELEEEFRLTIHESGFLIWSDKQDDILRRAVNDKGAMTEKALESETLETRLIHQLKLFFDLPQVAIHRDRFSMRLLITGRYLEISLTEEELEPCRSAELANLVRNRKIAVDDQMLSRIGILFHRLDRAMQARLFSGPMP